MLLSSKSAAAIAVVVATSLGAAACGSAATDKKKSPKASTTTAQPSDGASAETHKTAAGCAPARVSTKVAGKFRTRVTVDQGRQVAAKLGDSRVELEVIRTKKPASILLRFGKHKTFKPPPRSSLVAITYRLQNQGPGHVKPALVLNRQAVVKSRSGKFYRAAEGSGCNVPLSASWAVGQHASSPQAVVKAGKSATTSIVFLVSDAIQVQSLNVPSESLAVTLDKPSSG